MDALIDDMPLAHIHMPRHDREYAVKVGLRQLLERGILIEVGGRYVPVEAYRDLLAYYANSIRHLLPEPENIENSATAK
jgi:glycerol-3-phosphate O-acyltransferase